MYPRAINVHAKSLPRVLKCEGSKQNIGFYMWKGELGELALCLPVSACSDPMQKGVGRGNRGIYWTGAHSSQPLPHAERKQFWRPSNLPVIGSEFLATGLGTLIMESFTLSPLLTTFLSQIMFNLPCITVSCGCLLQRHCTRLDPGSEL